MQNAEEQLHNAQHSLSEFLKSLRVCQLAIKKQALSDVKPSLTTLVNDAIVLSQSHLFWFDLYSQSHISSVAPLTKALVNALDVGIRLSRVHGYNLETTKQLLFTICLTIFNGREILEKLTIDPKLTSNDKSLLANLYNTTYKLASISPFQDNGTKIVLGNLLGRNAAKNLAMKTQSLYCLTVNYAFTLARNTKVKREPYQDTISQLALGGLLLPVPSRLSTFFPELILPLLLNEQSLDFGKTNSETFVRLSMEHSASEQEQYIFSYKENQKKPSNYVVQYANEPFDPIVKIGPPTFKIEQLNNLSLRLYRNVLSNNIPFKLVRNFIDKMRFNAPEYYGELIHLVNTAPVSKIERLLAENNLAQSIINLASDYVELNKPLTLKHAVTLLGIERLPIIMLSQQFELISAKQKTTNSMRVVGSLQTLITCVAFTADHVDTKHRANCDVVICNLIMSGLITLQQNIDKVNCLVGTGDKIDGRLSTILQIEDDNSWKVHSAQFSMNWALNKSVGNIVSTWFDYSNGKTPLRLIPNKYHGVFLCIDLACSVFQYIQNGGASYVEMSDDMLSIAKLLGIKKQSVESLINLIVERTSLVTSLE